MKSEGDILKELIKKSGLSQEQFAVKLGTTRVTVSTLTKRGRISEDWKLRISEALGIGKDVFTGKDIAKNGTIEEPDEEYTKIRKAELDAMQTLISSMAKHIERLENQK